MQLLLSLIQIMSVFLVVAYLYSKSRAFKPLTMDVLGISQKLYLYLFFSMISIMGTYLGYPVQGALANTRAIGPILAGIIGGPLLGGTVGLTGGLHRYFYGGFTAAACGFSTTVEGLIGGAVHLYLVRNNLRGRTFDPLVAFFTTVFAEMVQMIILLIVAKPWVKALALVETISMPMILTSSIGAALFISIIRDQRSMFEKAASIFSAKAFKIAERTMHIMAKGFNSETAPEIARIIYQEADVGAVAITDTEKVIAFVGQGSDHHKAGSPIASPLTLNSINENKVVFADGEREHYRCTISKTCPLNSVLVAPLHIDNRVIGTIKLYESRNRFFHKMNKTLGEGISNLLSSQLLISSYEKQKHLIVMSELKLIQAQINPHFLFNSLNTIVAILRHDGSRARDLLIHLSNFFRKNLKRASDIATLEEELDHVNSYLKIEKARLEERLTIETQIDPSLLNLRLPAFTLQPLVENAIKHGISTMLGKGIVRIHARREGEVVLITIEDNAGTFCEQGSAQGLGNQIVDKRLKICMGENFGTKVFCMPNTLTRVTVTVPYGEQACFVH